ncbi:hypothetical protein DUNSADRAFT_14529 [Dunaliella salina]|uniref:Uncharacterized protein n=1 Tax=Dunaliella salina TaxID=3046 RepID=A0ABQ7G783_DUNSA|nr:hypothetical protein DUNSADRAFT_14529 [Dunaliella salina]|eukprot:KAF5830472.1 hypothetical protein DUNSADRAFT_14529 [Dunaliella salina]
MLPISVLNIPIYSACKATNFIQCLKRVQTSRNRTVNASMLSTEQSCKLLAYNVVINTRLLCQLKLMPYITTSVSKYAACCL